MQQKRQIVSNVDRSVWTVMDDDDQQLSLYYIEDTCITHSLSNGTVIAFHVYRVSSAQSGRLQTVSSRIEIRYEIIRNMEQFLVSYEQVNAHTFRRSGFVVAMKQASHDYDVFTDDGSVTTLPGTLFEGLSLQLSNEEAKTALHFGHFTPPLHLAPSAIPPPLQAALLQFVQFHPSSVVSKADLRCTWLTTTFHFLQLSSVRLSARPDE